MSDEYGTGSDPLDIIIGVHGLRTFIVSADGKLSSVTQRGGHWEDGVCIARCLAYTSDDPDNPHVAPEKDCRCGIYATLSLEVLFSQYPEPASRIVTVIAAEGKTRLGTVGLRTAAARVVAYWVADPLDHPVEAKACADQLPGARRFFNMAMMARMYELGE
jgi:hypothetical protein